VGVKFSSPKWDYYQTLLSRGDSSLTDYIIEVYRQGGKLGAYKSVAKSMGIDTSKYTTTEISSDYVFAPIIMRPSKDALQKEYTRLISKS
jgi:hypothetical protein